MGSTQSWTGREDSRPPLRPPSPPPSRPPSRPPMEVAEEAKAKGNAAFFSGNFTEAIKFFSEAIDLAPSNHLLYSNRSASYASLNQYHKALDDAKKTVELKSDWAKGYSRLGAAYVGLRSFQDAIGSYKKGLEIDPGDEGLKWGLAHAQWCSCSFSPMELWAKLSADPTTRGYLQQPDFVKMFLTNPAPFNLVYTDQRMMNALGVLLKVPMRGGEDDCLIVDLDECIVLNGDPDKPLQVAKDSVTTGSEEEEEELLLVAEKGHWVR